jgi:hypothetical protein
MSKSKNESFFWTSYSDLMTSLFFVMLVLFILTIVLLHNKIKATEEQLKKIQNIQESIQNIDSIYFTYNDLYKKHVLNISIQYGAYKFDPHTLSFEEQLKLLNAGKSIKNFVDRNSSNDIGYLIIIEGQASNDGFCINKLENNDVISFNRALWLKKFWEENNLDIGSLVNCELIVAGSGDKGVPRLYPDIPPANQRFLIHIIPKFGQIKMK